MPIILQVPIRIRTSGIIRQLWLSAVGVRRPAAKSRGARCERTKVEVLAVVLAVGGIAVFLVHGVGSSP